MLDICRTFILGINPPILPKQAGGGMGVQGLSIGVTPTDKAGKEVCLSFNKGNCTFHNCKFAHSCSKCGEDHPASSHEAGNGQ